MTYHLLYDRDNDVWLLDGPEAPDTRVVIDYDGEPLVANTLDDIGTIKPYRVVPVTVTQAAAIEMYARHMWDKRSSSSGIVELAEEWRGIVKDILQRTTVL